jgi:hypothetical protein
MKTHNVTWHWSPLHIFPFKGIVDVYFIWFGLIYECVFCAMDLTRKLSKIVLCDFVSHTESDAHLLYKVLSLMEIFPIPY